MSVLREDFIHNEGDSLGLITKDKVDISSLFQKLARSRAPSNINCDFKSNIQMIQLHSLPKSPSTSFLGNTSMKETFYPMLPSQAGSTFNSPANQSMKGFIPHSVLGSGGVKTRRKFEETATVMLPPNQNRRFVNKSLISENTFHSNISGFTVHPGQTQSDQKFFDVKGLLKARSKGSHHSKESHHTLSSKDLHQNLNSSQPTIVYNYKPVKINHLQVYNHQNRDSGEQRSMGVGRNPRKVNKSLRLPKLNSVNPR